jgi:hypothetical protein
MARWVSYHGNHGLNVLDQSKFAKTLIPNIADSGQKSRLPIINPATKNDERAICATGELPNDVPIRSVRVEFDNSKSARVALRLNRLNVGCCYGNRKVVALKKCNEPVSRVFLRRDGNLPGEAYQEHNGQKPLKNVGRAHA